MKLCVATLFHELETILVGVYSTPALAISAGENMIREISQKEPCLLDWDHEHPKHRYFFDGFTLTVTEVTLDQAV